MPRPGGDFSVGCVCVELSTIYEAERLRQPSHDWYWNGEVGCGTSSLESPESILGNTSIGPSIAPTEEVARCHKDGHLRRLASDELLVRACQRALLALNLNSGSQAIVLEG